MYNNNMFFLGQEISSANYILFEDDDENSEHCLNDEIKGIEIKFTNCDKYINIVAETTAYCNTYSWLEVYDENYTLIDFVGKKISSIEYIDEIELYAEPDTLHRTNIYSIRINFEDETNFNFELHNVSNEMYAGWIDVKIFDKNENPMNAYIDYQNTSEPSFSILYETDKKVISVKKNTDFTIEDLLKNEQMNNHTEVYNVYPQK